MYPLPLPTNVVIRVSWTDQAFATRQQYGCHASAMFHLWSESPSTQRSTVVIMMCSFVSSAIEFMLSWPITIASCRQIASSAYYRSGCVMCSDILVWATKFGSSCLTRCSSKRYARHLIEYGVLRVIQNRNVIQSLHLPRYRYSRLLYFLTKYAQSTDRSAFLPLSSCCSACTSTKEDMTGVHEK